jgi:hypothetical protein
MDAQIRGWYRSIFGAYREHRGHVLQHLSWANYMNPAPDANFAQYLGLPEEKDAFLTQDEVLARLSNALEMWGKVTPSADAKNVISAGNTARLREKFGS